MRPARSSSYLRLPFEPSARVELAPFPYRGNALPLSYDGVGGLGGTRTLTSPECEPGALPLRYEPKLFRWGDRRESNPHSGSHRPVRFPYATTTMIAF